jgi:formate-dependent nitrite reductase cytochrome c552 subunit
MSIGAASRTLELRVDADPIAVMFKKSTRSPVHAWICAQCGYIELYADNPGELYQAFATAKSTLPDLAWLFCKQLGFVLKYTL